MQVRPSICPETEALSHKLEITMRQYFKWPTLFSVVEVECISFLMLTNLFKRVAKWRNYTSHASVTVYKLPTCRTSLHKGSTTLQSQHQALDAAFWKDSELAGTLEVKVTLNPLLTLQCLVYICSIHLAIMWSRTATIQRGDRGSGVLFNVA